MVSRAAFLAVLPEELVCRDQPVAIVSRLISDHFANRAISARVILLLLAEEDPRQHSNAVRFQSEHRYRSCEQ